MGIFTYESEHSSAISPLRLFKACFREGDKLIPQIAPQAIKCSEILEGNGGPGTIKKITFGEGSQFGYVKHRIDNMDDASYNYCYTLIEGDILSDKIEKIEYEMKLLANVDGGCTMKSVSKYYTIGDVEIKEEHVKSGQEEALGLIKLIEAHLQAHPDLYI